MTGTYSYYYVTGFISHPLLYRAVFLVLSSITCCAVISVMPTKQIPVLTDYGQQTLFFLCLSRVCVPSDADVVSRIVDREKLSQSIHWCNCCDGNTHAS